MKLSSLLSFYLKLKLRREEILSIQEQVLAVLLIKKNIFISEILNHIEIFTYQSDFKTQMFLLLLKYIFPY